MTFLVLKKIGGMNAIVLGLTVGLPVASANAVNNPAQSVESSLIPSFQVMSTTDGKIRSSVRAFKKGEYNKAIKYNQAALNSRLSKRKAAIAQSNLCAAYAMLGQMTEAKAACDIALDLRPDYAPALANKAALVFRLTQK